MVPTSGLFSWDNSQSSQLTTLLGREFKTLEFPLENLSSGREGEFRESLSLCLLLFQWLQLKIINTTKRHILGWWVLDSFKIVFLLLSLKLLSCYLCPLATQLQCLVSEISPQTLLRTQWVWFMFTIDGYETDSSPFLSVPRPERGHSGKTA